MTYIVLENFSNTLKQQLTDIWNNQTWDKVVEASPGTFFHYCLNPKHEMVKQFPFADSVEFYWNKPGSSTGPHLDRGRWAAINIPIDVDHDNSAFVIGKEFHLKNYRRKTHLDKPDATPWSHSVPSESGPTGFFYEDEPMFNYYNLEKPVLFSTKVPHGYTNKKSARHRVLCSVTFKKSWSEMVHLIPQEWY